MSTGWFGGNSGSTRRDATGWGSALVKPVTVAREMPSRLKIYKQSAGAVEIIHAAAMRFLASEKAQGATFADFFRTNPQTESQKMARKYYEDLYPTEQLALEYHAFVNEIEIRTE